MYRCIRIYIYVLLICLHKCELNLCKLCRSVRKKLLASQNLNFSCAYARQADATLIRCYIKN